MRAEPERLVTRTLMCRDHEVLRFRFDPVSRRLKGKATMLDARYLPIGRIDHIVANFDRHWGNFGVLMDTESRT